MEVLELKVGNDNGNSEHDIVINGYQISQPNVCRKVRKVHNLEEQSVERIIKDIENNLIVDIAGSSVVEAGTYYIGNFAVNSGGAVKNIEIGVDNNKINSDIVIINTLAQIAGFAVKQTYMTNKKVVHDINVSVDMTTALPVTQYSRANADFFVKRFEGVHTVNVRVATEIIRVTVDFDFIKVIPEGVTAIHAMTNVDKEMFGYFNNYYKTNIDKTYFNNKHVLHVAVGEGTTEYPITNGINFLPTFIHGSNNGMGIAINQSLTEFKTAKKLQDFSRQEYSNALINKNDKYHNDAEEIIDIYIEEQAEEIMRNIKTQLQNIKYRVDMVAVYGGGSILMRRHLEDKLKELCKEHDLRLLYVPVKYAVTLESLGLYYFTIGEIFQALKNRSKK